MSILRNTTEDRFTILVETLVKYPDVTFGSTEKKGFGSSALKIKGKIFALISSKGEFVVKLPKQRIDELIVAGDGKRFDHFGRIFKEWFAVESPFDEKWLSLAKEAMAFVASIH